MELQDSRRLTGPNLLWNKPGAVVEVTVAGERSDDAVRVWEQQARLILDAVGWSGEQTCVRTFQDGAALAISAPIDALYAATEINEWAWESACAVLDGRAANFSSRGLPSIEESAQRLRHAIEQERKPAWLALQEAASDHGVTFVSDDDELSVGTGRGSLTWPVHSLPSSRDIDWSVVHDVPMAMVTGTNGKTTTVRLVAAMAAAAGRVAGTTSSDWIRVGDEILQRGDYSGPGGARTVLRDRRVDLAILETARGGMLRRGLAVPRADVVAITNVAEDHLGEFGVCDLDALIDAKWIVTRAAGPGSRVVLNADDDALVKRASQLDTQITWCSLSSAACHCSRPAAHCFIDNNAVTYSDGTTRRRLVAVEDMPFAFGGAARHNIANALTAVAIATALGIPWDAIVRALREFTSGGDDNPGRGNLFDIGGVRMLVDFAHNPHGLEALLDLAAALPARRRLVILGQGGDRGDDAIRQLTSVAWAARPDRIILKDLPAYLRGRERREVPDFMKQVLLDLGAPEDFISQADSEIEAVRGALRWAQPDDLLLLVVHESRNDVLKLLEALRKSAWTPGKALPA